MHSGVKQSCVPTAQSAECCNKHSPAAPRAQMLQLCGQLEGTRQGCAQQVQGPSHRLVPCSQHQNCVCCHLKHFRAIYSLHICIFLHCYCTIKLKTSDQAVQEHKEIQWQSTFKLGNQSEV